MQLVMSTIPKKIKALHLPTATLPVLFFFVFLTSSAQDNSPYSRFGIGDLTPTSHNLNRAMGGISAAFGDPVTVNFNNPASYAYFQGLKEPKSKKLISGRALFDVGIDLESRSLLQTTPVKKFKAGNALFSYIQLGVPLKKNWGLSFGLRPLSRISYNLYRNERLKDPLTGLPIDSASTTFTGDGGLYLVSLGSGFDIFNKQEKRKAYMEEKLSFGINAGYLFGRNDYSSRRRLINDTVDYQQGNFETRTNLHDFYFTAGLMYKMPVDTFKKISLSLGAYGHLGQNINATQDILRETYTFDDALGDVRLDSVSDKTNIKGVVKLPASFTFGFALQKPVVMIKDRKEAGWLFGVDFTMNKWDNYRFYGQKDSVKSNWEIKARGQIPPIPTKSYFSQISYRAGFFYGPEYIQVGNKMNRIGASFGMGLPIALNRNAPNQFTIINLAFEYMKRGNDSNKLKENLFRFSLGFSFSDLWFGKRKYD